ncbi:MAG: UDP-N-acetylenolpyruvoylglucosamine reductase, partial [Angelakisella sp.]|nr:UDP-N-acetylenolpyruvoylglucosamine reductase [Angelakisella sp.]
CVILSACFCLEKDPEGPEAVGARMEEIYRRRREKQPLEWPSAGSTFKRPEGAYAAALIDQCGLKGLRVGGAQVSEKHAGFVINAGGATCADVLALIGEVQRIVKEKTGFILEPEVRVTGEN